AASGDRGDRGRGARRSRVHSRPRRPDVHTPAPERPARGDHRGGCGPLPPDARSLPCRRARRDHAAPALRRVDRAALCRRAIARSRSVDPGEPLSMRPPRIGLISVHTCPLAALGGKETGGMNVYIREVARHLGRLGLEVDVFTRSQTPGVPEVVPLGPGARVVHVVAGAQQPMPPVEIVAELPEFIDAVEAFRRRTDGSYALLHGHYWLSGLVAVELARRWGRTPVVQMFHTLGVVKNAVSDDPGEWAPQVRLDAEAQVAARADRIVAATSLERAELAWYCGEADARVRKIPCGV